MKEIGGYLGLDEPMGKEYHLNLIPLNTARNALIYVVKSKKIEKVYIPYFLCESVSGVLEREGCSYEQYHISPSFLPCLDKKLEKNEYLYFVNYYGMFDNEQIIELKEKYGNIIVDNVHAFFQTPIFGVDTIYSCRKFFGVPDGAYLSTNTPINEELDIDASRDRMTHVLGRYEEENASRYYSNFKANDAAFKQEKLKLMSKLTHNLLSSIDYEKVKAKREENYKYLEEKLNDKNVLNIKKPVGPYAYPFYIKNGMQIKKQLAEKKIYVATLWPNALCLDGTIEKDYAENILPLPVDQRYDRDDMKRIVEELLKCLN